MKLLYFTLEGFDTPNPNNNLAETLINQLLESGQEIHLVQSERENINSSVPKELQCRDNLKVNNVKRKTVNKTSFIKRYIEESLYGFKSMRYWMKDRKSYDKIYVQSSATIVWSMILLKIFTRKPIIYVVYDIFPGQAHTLRIVKSKMIYKILQNIQNICYKISDKVVVLSEDMKNTLVDLNVKVNKINIIYPWYDEQIFKYIPKSENILFDKFDLDVNKFYVQYAGSLGQNFDFELIIKVSEELSSIDNEIVLLLIGDGVYKDEIIDLVNTKHIKNIMIFGMQKLDIICQVYNACDLGIVPLKKDVIKYGFPSKVCQLLACGKPIITNSDKSIYSDIINSGLGYASTCSDARAIAESIKMFKDNNEYLDSIRNNCLEYSKSHYTSKINCRKYLNIFEG